MNELLSFFSVDKEKMKAILASILLWQRGTNHQMPLSVPAADGEIVSIIYKLIERYFKHNLILFVA